MLCVKHVDSSATGWSLVQGSPTEYVIVIECDHGNNNPPHLQWVGRRYSILTPWNRKLLERPSVYQLVKKFPAFYRTRRFITAYASARHLSLSWACSIQSIPHPIYWRSIVILSSHLRLGLPSGLFPPGPRTKTLYTPRLGRGYRRKMKRREKCDKTKKQFLSFNLGSLYTTAGYSRNNFKWQFSVELKFPHTVSCEVNIIFTTVNIFCYFLIWVLFWINCIIWPKMDNTKSSDFIHERWD